MPDVVQHEEAGPGRVHGHLHFSVPIDLKGGSRLWHGNRSWLEGAYQRGLTPQEHRARRIEIWPTSVPSHPLEIRGQPIEGKHDTRKRARVLIDIRVAGVRNEREIPRLQVLVYLLDGPVGRDV